MKSDHPAKEGGSREEVSSGLLFTDACLAIAGGGILEKKIDAKSVRFCKFIAPAL